MDANYPYVSEGTAKRDRRNQYADIVRTSRIEAVDVYRIEPTFSGGGEIVMFTSQYPNSEHSHGVAYVKNGVKVWSMIVD